MRIGTALLLAAGALPAQDKPEYTFGTTVATNSWLQGQVYDLKPGTGRLPRLDRMKPTATIYTNMLNVWPQRFDQGFPGIMDRFEWFAIDYHGNFWIEQAGEYRFSLLSDDGARLAIDNQEFVNNDGIHAASALSGSAVLSQGAHTINVSYYQGPRFAVALPPPKDPAEWVTGKIGQVRKSVPTGRER